MINVSKNRTLSTGKDEEHCIRGNQEGARRGTGGTTWLSQTTAGTFPTGLRCLHTDSEEHQRSVASHQERVRIENLFLRVILWHQTMKSSMYRLNRNSITLLACEVLRLITYTY